MKPRCDTCKCAGVRLPYLTQGKGIRSWKPSPYFMCPKCLKIINIKCDCGNIRLIEPKSIPNPTKPEMTESIPTKTPEPDWEF